MSAFIIKNLNQKDWRDDLISNTVAMLPADKYLKKKNWLVYRLTNNIKHIITISFALTLIQNIGNVIDTNTYATMNKVLFCL